MNDKRMLFEVSWEVCNMVGGIHTVLVTKVRKMQERYGENYVLIGPDMSRNTSLAGIFREEAWHPEILKGLSKLKIGCKMGRWLVPGEPKCILLQFDALFEKKDQILADYWEKFGLNSLPGGHDYLEPVIFSHAAGMVIERIFCDHLLHKGLKTVVHCHEWLACAALLYLKDRAPEIGTVFTTHATTLGRTLSSHHWDQNDPSQKESIQPEYLAQKHGVVAKHSIESISARMSDSFTTVSSITAEECEMFFNRKPDVLTLNGLGDESPDPQLIQPGAVAAARRRLLEIANITTGHSYPPERTTMLVSAGRYEFQNKGVDLTLEALANLNRRLREQPHDSGDFNQRVIAFMMFPAGHTGPRQKILHAYRQGRPSGETFFSTHGLRDEEHDPILSRMAPLGFRNSKDDPVHIVFVPIYLNGSDPLVPETYYQLLAGADLTVFPSFYEPWGYTPEESAAMSIPTITSDLAGYGLWARQFGDWNATGVYALPRKGQPFNHSRDQLCAAIEEFLQRNPEQRQDLRRAVLAMSHHARWGEFGKAYLEAHDQAITKAHQRMQSATYDRFRTFSAGQVLPPTEGSRAPAHIRRFTVQNKLPSILEKMRTLVRENLWWSWNPELCELLSELDPELWELTGKNPLVFIDRVRPEMLEHVAKSRTYAERAELALSRFTHYMSSKKEPEVAYFCMEYGLSHILKLYSGGLGILAGDHLKTASDMGIPLCALGLAYRFGYFRQRINADGAQESHYETNDFKSLPMSPVNDSKGARILFSISTPTGPVWMQAWKVAVGRVDLYLLDTDLSENSPADRSISDRLYGGDSEHRLRQEFILAIGGHELLRRLGIKAKVFHMNEGHTAFLVLSRVAQLVQDEKIKFEEALEYVRHSTGFTTHTPVAAGHDHFPEGMVAPYLQLFTDPIGEPLQRLQELGRGLDKSRETSFSMTLLAVRGSTHINAVSKIHGKVSRRMFHALIPQFHENEVPVSGITNGVHSGTWVAPEWQAVFSDQIGADWRDHLSDAQFWNKARQLDSALVWQTHVELKKKLVKWLRGHLRETWERRREHPANLATALANLSEDTFIATFARRFAPYKRANLLFRDPARLAKLLSGDVPMVFLFAGKAHPSDVLGQNLITKVIELARKPEFFGRILFVENYEIDVAQSLVWGSDLWINNPIRPLEASGTSGMKAAMNGCLNLSVADGWWAEGYNGKNGWVIGDESLTQSPEFQDTFDSSHLYSLLEREVLPRYKARARGGVPEQWTTMMKESIASIVPAFNTERMLAEYNHDFYQSACERSVSLASDRYVEIRRLIASRKRLLESWKSISFVDIEVMGLETDEIYLGQPLKMKVRLAHPNLRPQDIQVETVLSTESQHPADLAKFQTYAMKCIADENDGRESAWEVSIQFGQTGPQSLGVRVVPRPCHDNHRVDLMLDMVKWL
ncbi:MAG: hypothetical protein A2428_14695 [Bdellovibrionales bacterium RIFOXYC1_FULL_54_43]|nr:MAG: hypothetical protein A2428_14695 [Bdellovibrionales bacterium RIFOXYC1_FULL_54_43]OFZ80866.1 MAG: hypothetical protein A2603_05770 [Bdellovibrionales bacterium RIFOXYD1_FULL_55_31]